MLCHMYFIDVHEIHGCRMKSVVRVIVYRLVLGHFLSLINGRGEFYFLSVYFKRLNNKTIDFLRMLHFSQISEVK